MNQQGSWMQFMLLCYYHPVVVSYYMICALYISCLDDAMLSAVVEVINKENSTDVKSVNSNENSNINSFGGRGLGLADIVTAGYQSMPDNKVTHSKHRSSWSSASSEHLEELSRRNHSNESSKEIQAQSTGSSRKWTSLHL